jgi:hypothetical protein
MKRLHGLFLLLFVTTGTSGCAPLAREGNTAPVVGTYPRESIGGNDSPTDHRRPVVSTWVSADSAIARIVVDGADDVFAGPPEDGIEVGVRRATWPRPVRVARSSTGRIQLQGEQVAIAGLSAELRCRDESGVRAVRLVGAVTATAAGASVELRFDSPGRDCSVSGLGRQRLQRGAIDVYAWLRKLARDATPVPAPY